VSYHLLVVVGAVAAVDQTARVSGVLLFTQESLLLGTGGMQRRRVGGKERGDKRKEREEDEKRKEREPERKI
jgi:hypothetical protein